VTVLRSASATDVGRVRNANQDLPFEGPNLFAVADGMGGHVGGEVAARVAVEALQSAFARQPSVTGLREAVAEANTAVWERSQAQDGLRGMGTTLTAAALVAQGDGRDVIALANVGDSRAYVFSDGAITQVTADHSLAEEKVRHGELTEAQAAVHPHRHILTRALGVSPEVDVDLWELHLQAGDRILLCSDGLTNEVDPAEIARILADEAEPSDAAKALVRAANAHGGNDNITVVVIDILVGEEGAGGFAEEPAAAGAAFEAPEVAPDDAGASAAPPMAAVEFAATHDDLFVRAAPDGSAPEQLAVPAAVAGEEVDGEGAEPAAPSRRERRRERRRQRRMAGIPRWITLRVVLFAVLVVAVVAAGYGFLRWYATDNWYVTLDGNHLAVYQGRPGGFLWFQPKLVDRSDVTTSDVLSFHVPSLKGDTQQPSLSAARHYIDDLHEEFIEQKDITSGQSTVSATTLPPSTTTTSTTPTTTTRAG
jgi:protein phosphatase